MARILPLPQHLVIVDRWTECGQGRDPLCESVELLVRDRRSDEPPVASLARHLQQRGWRVTVAEGRAVGSLGAAEVRVVSLASYLADEATPGPRIEGFLREHDPGGFAYVRVYPSVDGR